MKNQTVVNAFTVDFEDWYQGIELPVSNWNQYEHRLEFSGGKILDVLKQFGVKATFFVLGENARHYPHLVRRIVSEGHSIGTHGDCHEYVYKMTPDDFKRDLETSILSIEKACGVKPRSYRAPFFSITKESFWALDHLKEFGIEYDSSIVPVKYYRYGIPDAPDSIHSPITAVRPDDRLTEFPINTVKMAGKRIPISGGTYFRLFPYKVVRDAIRKFNSKGQPVVFYIHPWEVDPEHPRIDLPKRIGLTHYANLNSTLPKLNRLLADFRFSTMEEVINAVKN
jgi:polysaccharide deacetylase family protein (PEP-CTERM system associated)